MHRHQHTWFVQDPMKWATRPLIKLQVKSLTHSFFKHVDLLPAGDTLHDHHEKLKKHADDVQRDRNNNDKRTGGLFKGLFRRRIIGLRPIRDDADGVERCPYCNWELEEGMCIHCGLPFDENGNGAWGENFSGFSDMDQTSGTDRSSEDLDPEMDVDDPNEDLVVDFREEWVDEGDVFDAEIYDDEDTPYMVQRYMAGASPSSSQYAQRGRAAHSAAGSRRRSYTSSMMSDMQSEMGTLEEEDEEDADGDSSMNDFINDEEDVASGSQSSASVSEATPQPPARSSFASSFASSIASSPNSRGQSQASSRRQQSSQPPSAISTSSSRFAQRNRRGPNATGTAMSAPISVDEEDEEDEDPIPSGRRQQSSQQSARQTGRRNRRVVDEEDEEWGYRPLGQGSQAGGVDGEDENADSDGTTVGLAQNTNSSRRARPRASLTPTADRQSIAPRPYSRSGSSRYPLGSRGLRRRSSVLSTSSSHHYEDNDADDEDIDQDGDITMTQAPLRQRGSVIHLRNVAQGGAVHNQGRPQPAANVVDAESDDSDTSGRVVVTGQSIRRRRQEYDPRISFLFAQHLDEISQLHQQDPLAALDTLEQLRATMRTPLARPRTVNRNRTPSQLASPGNVLTSPSPGPGQQYMMNAPGRLRTPLAETHGSTVSTRPSAERGSSIQSRMSMTDASRMGISSREQSVASMGGSAASSSGRPTMVSPSSPGQSAVSTLSHGSLGDSIERPASRVSFRAPPQGRRGSGQIYPGQPQAISLTPGLNAVRAWQNNNPFFTPINPIRPRTSTQRLREQSSTATLRPRGSIRVLRNQVPQQLVANGPPSPTQVRPQASRIHLRPQPSAHRLSAQPSSRALRQMHHAAPMQHEYAAPSATATRTRDSVSASNPRSSPGLSSTLSEDERQRRAREMVERRSAELRGSNPFTRTQQQAGAAAGTLPTGSARVGGVSPNAVPSGGVSISANIVPSAATSNLTSPPINPSLGRRRSNRVMAQQHLGSQTGLAQNVGQSNTRPMASQSSGAPGFHSTTQLNITRPANPVAAGIGNRRT
jgi:hypothetical protein